MKQFFTMSAKNGVGRMDIYDEIGFFGTTAVSFARQWRDLVASSKRIEVHISSPGGNLFDGLSIYNMIQQSDVPVDIFIDGLAASSASLIAMAGRKSYMAENGLLMMHNPKTWTMGGKKEHEASLRALEAGTEAIKVAYVSKSGKTNEEISAYLDEETWLGAQEAKDEGFIDKIVKAQPMATKFDVNVYGYSVPEQFLDRLVQQRQPEEAAQQEELIAMSDTVKPDVPKPATIAEIEAACDGSDGAFVLAQLKAQATVSQAQASWTKLLAQRLSDEKAKSVKLETEKTALESVAKTLTGNEPVGPKGEGAPKIEASGDAIVLWDDAVAEKTAKGMPKSKAISLVAKTNPDLHSAYIAAYNDLHGGKRKSA